MFSRQCQKNLTKGHFCQIFIKIFLILSFTWLVNPAWATFGFGNTPGRSTNIALSRSRYTSLTRLFLQQT